MHDWVGIRERRRMKPSPSFSSLASWISGNTLILFRQRIFRWFSKIN